MNTHIGASLFGEETFGNNWIIVTDSNNCDVPVILEDLLGEKPEDEEIYEKVYYCNQSWWIPKSLHFPM